jgi:hypothetical protein
MAKTNLASTWDSNGNLVFTANASGSGSMVFNTATPVVLGTQHYPLKTVTSLTTGTDYTLSAAQILGGIVLDIPTVNCNALLPTVAQCLSLIPGWQVGTSFKLTYRNAPASAQAINVRTDALTQWTEVGNCVISANYAKVFEFVVTAANTGTVYASSAYSIAA